GGQQDMPADHPGELQARQQDRIEIYGWPPVALGIQLLAARIQKDEKSVPNATISAATKCAQGGTSLRTNNRTSSPRLHRRVRILHRRVGSAKTRDRTGCRNCHALLSWMPTASIVSSGIECDRKEFRPEDASGRSSGQRWQLGTLHLLVTSMAKLMAFRDQPRAALAGEIGPHPLVLYAQPILQLRKRQHVNECPHQPGQEAARAQRASLQDRI